MKLRVRDFATIYAGLLLVVVLAIMLEPLVASVDHRVRLALALAALVALPASFASRLLAALRAARARQSGEQVQVRIRAHVAIMAIAPLVVMGAHPWGTASIAVAFGALVLCQVLFLHALIVAGLIMQRRARTTPPR